MEILLKNLVSLRSKLYAIKPDDVNIGKRAKGIKKCAGKKK